MFFCKNLLQISFFLAFSKKPAEMTISTSVWSVQHPNAGRNIQQLSVLNTVCNPLQIGPIKVLFNSCSSYMHIFFFNSNVNLWWINSLLNNWDILWHWKPEAKHATEDWNDGEMAEKIYNEWLIESIIYNLQDQMQTEVFMSLDSNIDSKSLNNTYLNIIEILFLI